MAKGDYKDKRPWRCVGDPGAVKEISLLGEIRFSLESGVRSLLALSGHFAENLESRYMVGRPKLYIREP